MKKQIISFLEAYILLWDEFINNDYSEYYGATLTKMLQSFCLRHKLPYTMSADDLLADIKSELITVEDEPCNG